MTGELCDCFANKAEGVHHILEALKDALPDKSKFLWRNDGRLIAFEAAGSDLLSLAAANWLALACFTGRFAPRGTAILIDMGSTTTDIIPLIDAHPEPIGRTDLERIRNSELVYVGASRTPLCALLGRPYAAEWFATTQDVYLLLGLTEEAPENLATADGRPATRENAHARVARMLCADAGDLSAADTREIANQADRVLRQSVRVAVERVSARSPGKPHTVIVSGSGELLIEKIVAETFDPLPRIVSLHSLFGAELSSCACAFALAMLAQEHLSDERTA